MDALRDVALDAGLSMVEMAVGWVLAHPLDPEVKDRIDALTAHFRLGDAER